MPTGKAGGLSVLSSSESLSANWTNKGQGPESPGRSPPGKTPVAPHFECCSEGWAPVYRPHNTALFDTDLNYTDTKLCAFAICRWPLCTNFQQMKLGKEGKPLVPATLEAEQEGHLSPRV